ncbi:NADH dehydrogenase subunit 2 [Orobanche gracilis]
MPQDKGPKEKRTWSIEPGWIRAGIVAPIQHQFRKGSLMLEGASPLSDRSASSRKSEEVITDEPHAGKLARVVLAPRYLITLLLLADGAPLLTIAYLFWNNLFRRDNFTYFCQILLLLSTAGTISMCFDSSEQERFDAFEFIVLIPLPTRSMLFMISAYDSIAMYLAIEPQSLCFYVIAASKRKSEFSTEAGSKYLILGAFSSGILLFGYDRTTTDIY